MSPWERLLEKPHSGGHFVQLYNGDETGLAENVCRYSWEGLKRGEGVLLIVTPQHQALFSRHLHALGADLDALLNSRQLVCWDAHGTLSRFIRNGQPDWRLFEKTVCDAIREVRPADGVERMRAYGEMVGLLWQACQFAAATRLEQLWNKLLAQSSISLYCTYAIDIFEEECDLANLENLLCAHTHLIPYDTEGYLEAAICRSMDEVLGPRSEELQSRIRKNCHPSRAIMPTAEKTVLWLRNNLPAEAGEIVSLARQYYNELCLETGIRDQVRAA